MLKIGKCANISCQWPIYKGDRVWKAGGNLYCHIQCAIGYHWQQKAKN